jgi:diketogulonate reductase-like aldo/keto reductase
MLMTRRTLLQSGASLVCAALAGVLPVRAIEVAERTIPSSGERLPLVGLGSWITFNVGNDTAALKRCTAVMDAFFLAGGRMIDCSPMYGSSQRTIGYALQKLGYPRALFSAEKVWASDASEGPAQMRTTLTRLGTANFDLMQIHNLLAWQGHLKTLREMKANGALRYIGITTSHGRRHADIERILATEAIDFVQVTYNVLDREVEGRILPLARERGVAVIINRPFQRGALLDRVERHALPDWVAETGATSWAQFLLKFVISHPAVTCAIPATSQVAHVRENLAASVGILPDEALRKRMVDYVRQL